MTTTPHRRHNPLTGDWVLVSPGRAQRPWLGQVDPEAVEEVPAYDPECALCPGNTRASGLRNPEYEAGFMFSNDFPALRPGPPAEVSARDGLLRRQPVSGTCRVVCFSPRHDLSLASLGSEGIRRVVDLWIEQVSELSADHQWVQVFENRGTEMGASNPHPHGQIWASSVIPTVITREDTMQRQHHDTARRPLLLDCLDTEFRERIRVVVDHAGWAAVVPFWATWPFEILLLPKIPVERLTDLDTAQRHDLALILEELLARYDNLFHRPFPYSMGWHGAPGTGSAPHWQLHAHFFPPLLEHDQRKFMVGYELLSEVQRDLTAEEAAARLRTSHPVHYSATAP